MIHFLILYIRKTYLMFFSLRKTDVLFSIVLFFPHIFYMFLSLLLLPFSLKFSILSTELLLDTGAAVVAVSSF